MEKQKKWQRYLIIVVIALTIYNILPTVFYYTKPLKSPISETKANEIAKSAIQRVNHLEPESEKWIESYCKLLNIHPLGVHLDPTQPQFIKISFKNREDATLFRTALPRAGSLIPFVPSQLSLHDPQETTSKAVIVQRKIPIHFDLNQLSDYVQFSQKFDKQHQPTPLYRALTEDRALQIGVSLAGPSENAMILRGLDDSSQEKQSQDLIIQLAQDVLSYVKAFGEQSPVSQRYFASFTQVDTTDRYEMAQKFLRSLETLRSKLKTEKRTLQEEGERLHSQGEFLETLKQQKIEILSSREQILDKACGVVKRNLSLFASGKPPFSYSSLQNALRTKAGEPLQELSLEGKNPFISHLVVDWNNEKIYLIPHSDIQATRSALDETLSYASLRDLTDQLLYDEIAHVSRLSGETISPFQDRFEISLNQLMNSQSFLALRLSKIASELCNQLKKTLHSTWHPKHPDLSPSSFPICDEETFRQLPASEQAFGLVIYSPSLSKQAPPQGFRMNSVYIIAKGMNQILDRFKNDLKSSQAAQFVQDFNQLYETLQHNGFVGYSGSAFGMASEFAQDFIFETTDYYLPVLKATRENFTTHGTKRYAILELTDVEQRLLTENKIDNAIHEDLLKWRDDYHAAQLNTRGVSQHDVPKPTKNILWENFKLSSVKYFRGDDRKILRWGLDLSGGKTVQIELRDTNNRPVTDPVDIKQGINELYQRVNKMGVSEVSIRQEGNYITLDFPGSQNLSAGELVKASSMYFHIINEKFSPNHSQFAEATNRFLQEIWNEAVVTNRKEAHEINLIAWNHLYGNSLDPDVIEPRSEAARFLYEHGMRLSNPEETVATSAFNETYSKIAVYRGDDFTDWYGQTHPLIFVFRNFALEGANLENVRAGYDPAKGNFLSFSVKTSSTIKDRPIANPQESLYAWSSQFAKEKINGTPAETFSNGKGWRMAVVLNGQVISAPTLDAALKDNAVITGSFTQREISQLEADLKAGSLSFTPHILSEKNVSPELGAKEKKSGVVATILSMLLVIGAMIAYYRFGGLVASIAVIVNLLIMWAALQNLDAAMTLAGIAGIILTLGMAVDANVLVFERIREEFSVSKRITSAIHAGYRKAFSAIIDSNITTIIAAVILLHFDSGPIKAFAITMIVGILSSMFTSLFMTRFFFAGWVQNPKHKSLNMVQFFNVKTYNFLKPTKIALTFSSAVIVIGAFFLAIQRHTIFGMDFKGGYAINVELSAQPGINYRQKVESALLQQGASYQDFQVRELNPSNQLRIFLSYRLQQPNHPFAQIAQDNDLREPVYRFETNPKIVWVVEALKKEGLSLEPFALQNLDRNWTEVSGQMSDAMRNHAIIGLAIALFCILAYITVRFEFKYAISATICLAHDVIFTVAILAILHAIGVPLQIDLNTIAALMTIVGYSLNDTIIIFDRIREDVRTMRKSSLTEIINHALNVTLSRTVMTSGTTLLVLIPLILLGGSTLFGFALVMAIGVIFGTLSSLFIAAPLMKWFHDRETRREALMMRN